MSTIIAPNTDNNNISIEYYKDNILSINNNLNDGNLTIDQYIGDLTEYFLNTDKLYNEYLNIDNNLHKFDYDYNEINTTRDCYDIDFSYYTNDAPKKYMFYFDYLSQFYKNLSKIKKETFSLDDTVYERKFKIKNLYNSDIPINKNNIDFSCCKNLDIEFKINRNTTLLDYDNNNIFTDNFDILFKQIVKNNIPIDNSLDYYHLLEKVYEYRFYKLIINYYILFIIYKNINKDTDNILFKNKDFILQKLDILFSVFNKLFKNTFFKLNEIKNIIDNTEKKDIVLESQRIEESEIYTSELKELNRKSELEKYNVNRINNNIKYYSDEANKAVYKILITIIILFFTIVFYLNILNNTSIRNARIICIGILASLFIIYYFNYKNIEYFTLTDSVSKIDELKGKLQHIESLTSNLDSKITNINDYDESNVRIWDDAVSSTSNLVDFEIINYMIPIEELGDNDVGQLTSNISKMQYAYSNLNSKERELHDTLSSLESEKDQLIKDLEDASGSIIEYQEILSNIASFNINFDIINQELDSIEQQKETTYSQLQQLNGDLQAQLSTILLNKMASANELASMEDYIGDITEEIKDLNRYKQQINSNFIRFENNIGTEYAKTIEFQAEIASNNLIQNETIVQITSNTAIFSNLTEILESSNQDAVFFATEFLDLHETFKQNLKTDKETLDLKTSNVIKGIGILEQKIANIQSEIENRPKKVFLDLELSLKDTNPLNKITGNTDIEKNNFKNNIILELADITKTGINRFNISEIEILSPESNISINTVIYPSNAFGKLDSKKPEDIYTDITDKAKDDNTILRNKKYLKYLQKITKTTEEESEEVITDVPFSLKKLDLTDKINNNNILITDINSIINYINKTENTNKTYYDEINPYLIKELNYYREKKSDYYKKKKIINSKLNSKQHKYNYYNNISKFMIEISLLIVLLLIFKLFISDNNLLILLIGTIAFILLLNNLYFNIIKHTKKHYRNKYWQLPEIEI